jgi:site-specific DNA-methyltransferase (adenine-specific)
MADGKVQEFQTTHRLIQGDARKMSFLPDQSIHLVVTSPPYWSLKRYNDNEDQLGHVQDYEQFLQELAKVWKQVYRVLVPGGRLVCVVGDVCLSRRKFGRHVVVPLHADTSVACRKIGFDNLNPIIWHKISNAQFEANKGSKFLGKPYEPNAIIKNDIEYILMQRKPGGYRKPTPEQRRLSMIGKSDFNKWFRQFWNITGASTRNHPAPFPLELALRLVKMFSFVGDTILDPFCGSGTAMLAAMKCGRNSIGIEIDPQYCRMAAHRLKNNQSLFATAHIEFSKMNEMELSPGVAKKPRRHRVLKGLVNHPAALRSTYKGRYYNATLNPDGSIEFANKRYTNPSAAAKAVVNSPSRKANGWKFWHIKNCDNQWLRLSDYQP